jgi:hypothetical protein
VTRLRPFLGACALACGARSPLEAALGVDASLVADGGAVVDAAALDVGNAPDARACGACVLGGTTIQCWRGDVCTWGFDRTIPACAAASDLPPERRAPCGSVSCDVTLYACLDPGRGVCATRGAEAGVLPPCL